MGVSDKVPEKKVPEKTSDREGHYQILGIPRWASVREVLAAYKKRALQTHPDKGGDAKLFRQVREAFEVLADAEKRAAYDGSKSEQGDLWDDVSVARTYLSSLMLRRLPLPSLRGLTRPVLTEMKGLVEEMMHRPAYASSSSDSKADEKGITRTSNGEFEVKLGWRNFLIQARSVPDLEKALAIHCAMVKAREAAKQRFRFYCETIGSLTSRKTPQDSEAEHALTSDELQRLCAEVPWTYLFSSDLSVLRVREMSRWTPCLQTAIRYRGWIRTALTAKDGNRSQMRLKDYMSQTSKQQRDEAANFMGRLSTAIARELRESDHGQTLALEAAGKLALATDALQEERRKNDELRQQCEEYEDEIQKANRKVEAVKLVAERDHLCRSNLSKFLHEQRRQQKAEQIDRWADDVGRASRTSAERRREFVIRSRA